MPRHIQVPELGDTGADGLGSLDYIILPTVGNPITWDFQNKNTGNAKLELLTSLNLNVRNIPDGAIGHLFVTMGQTGAETLTFSGGSTRNGQSTPMLDRTPGSITHLCIQKYGALLTVSSSFLSIFTVTAPGLVPPTAGSSQGDVLRRDQTWGKVTRNSMSQDFDDFYLNRANHRGTQTSNTISDFTEAVRSNSINTLAPASGNVNMNMKRIVNLADPQDPNDAVNAIYVSDAITSEEALFFIQTFS